MAISYKSKFGQLTDQAQVIDGAKSFSSGLNIAANQDAYGGYESKIGGGTFRNTTSSSGVAFWRRSTGGSGASYDILDGGTVSITGFNGDQVLVHTQYALTQATGPSGAVYDLYAWMFAGTTFGTSVVTRTSLLGTPTAPSIAWIGSGTTRTLRITQSTTFSSFMAFTTWHVRNSSGDAHVTLNISLGNL